MEQNNNFNKDNKKEVAQRENGRLFDPFFEDFFGFPTFRHEFRDVNRVMKTDVIEKEKGYDFEIEMPGVSKENINIELENGYLTITAKQQSKNDETDSKGNYVRRERHFGSFARSFYVGDIDQNEIQASLESGILKLYVPKDKQEKRKRIEIK